MSHIKEGYASIPSFSDVSAQEFALYTGKVAPNMIQGALQSGEIDIALFWSSMAHLPQLKKIAFRCIHAVTNTADVELSNLFSFPAAGILFQKTNQKSGSSFISTLELRNTSG